MNITILNKGSYSDFVLSELSRLRSPDVLVFSDGIIGKLDIIEEIDAKTSMLYELSVLSKSLSCVLVCGCDTEVCGRTYKSAVVIDCGKVLGVSHMAYVLDESRYSIGSGFRGYDTSKGMIGIIVGEDIYFPESAKTLTLTGSDVIICLFGKIYNHIPQLMQRAASFSNGVCIGMAAQGYMQITDIKGEVLCATDAKLTECNIEIVKDYHIKHTWHRGGYREKSSS